MDADWASFLSRDDLLGGLPARRASTLLFAIESRTAQLVARSRTAMATYLTERTAEEQEHAFFEALAEGRDLPIQPTVQDLERYAPEWASLVPPDTGVRASLSRLIGEKYLLPESGIRESARRSVCAIRKLENDSSNCMGGRSVQFMSSNCRFGNASSGRCHRCRRDSRTCLHSGRRLP